MKLSNKGAFGAALLLTATAFNSAHAAWEPTRTVEIIVPAGPGGGADQMARTVQGIISKHGLMKQSMVVINKAGGAGGEGFLDVKTANGNPHKLVITLSNLFTTPLATGIPFSWKDITPVAMMALDEFILWVNADKPYKTAKEYIDAAKAADGSFKMGGTGSKQEDQIITVALEKQTGAKFTYIPYKGGGEVAVQLVGNHVNSTRQQSDRGGGAVARRQASAAVRVRQQEARLQGQDRRRPGLGQHPDLQVGGHRRRVPDAARLLHGAGRDPRPGELLRRPVQEGARDREWKKLMSDGAFNQTFMTGKEYLGWVANEEKRHQDLMKDAGFLAQ